MKINYAKEQMDEELQIKQATASNLFGSGHTRIGDESQIKMTIGPDGQMIAEGHKIGGNKDRFHFKFKSED